MLAGCSDVVENIGLLTMIWLTTQQPLPALTWLASSAKFALIGFSFLASLVTLLWPCDDVPSRDSDALVK